MPIVSVLMPIYNTREEHLRAAIESILNQTFKQFEFLILNDSPDNEKLDEIVTSYDDSRIRYFKNKTNMGITPSRNKLLGLAQGKYIAIFDHDDISQPNRFEKQVAYMEANPNVGVLGTGIRQLPSGKEVMFPQHDEDIRMALMWGCVIIHPSAMVRRDVLVKNHIQYEERFTPSEDHALWCRLIPHTQFHNLQEILLNYRFHATNTSKKQADKMQRTLMAIRAFAAVDNPVLYKQYLSLAEHTTRVRLFGCLPLITIRRRGLREKIYLFDFIPLFSIKKVIKIR